MADVTIRFVGDSRSAVSAAKSLQRAIDSVGSSSQSTTSKLGAVVATLGRRALQVGIAGIGALAGAVAFAGVRFDDLKARAQNSFEVLLGSAEKAKQMIGTLAEFARSTPFEFPQLIGLSQQLLAAGFQAKTLVPTLEILGDTVAGLGGDPAKLDHVILAFQQMKAQGKIMSGDLRQLSTQGIPAVQILAKELGVTTAQVFKMMSKGAIDAETGINALLRGMRDRYDGLMEKQSHTFSGLLSNFKDLFSQLSGRIMGPLFTQLTKGMDRLNEKFNANREAVDAFADRLGRGVGKAAVAVVDWFKRNWDDLVELVKSSWEMTKKLAAAIKSIVGVADDAADAVGGWETAFGWILGGLAVTKVLALATAIRTALIARGLVALGVTSAAVGAQYVAAFGVMEIATIGLAATIKAALITTGIGLIVVALGYAVYWTVTHWDTVKRVTKQLAVAMKDSLGGAMTFFVGAAKFAAGSVLTFLTAAVRGMLELLSRLPLGAGKPFKKALDGLKTITTDWVADGAKQMAAGGSSMGQAWGDAFKTKVSDAAKTAVAAAAAAMGDVTAAFTDTSGPNAYKTGGAGFVQPLPKGTFKPGGGAKEHKGRPVGNWWSDNAIDLMAPGGTDVLAIEDGVVTAVTIRASNGKGVNDGSSIFFRGDSGQNYAYLHLDPASIRVKRGQRVAAGTVIAAVGTGTAGGDHLHLGVERGDPAAVTLMHAAGTGKKTKKKQKDDPAPTDDPFTGGGEDGSDDDSTKPSITDLPPALRLALAEAEATKTITDDVAVLQRIIALLERRKKAAKTAADKADVQDDLNQLRARLEEMRKGDEKIADAKDVTAISRQADYLFKRLNDAPAELLPRLRVNINAIRELLAGTVTEEDAERAKAMAERTMAALGRGLNADKIRDDFVGLKARLEELLAAGVFSDTERAAAETKISGFSAFVRKAFKDGFVSPAELAAIKGRFDELNKLADDGLGAFQNRVQKAADAGRAAAEKAYGKLTSRLSRLFEAQTQQLIDRVRVTVQTINGLLELGAGEETPAEKRARENREAREAAAAALKKANLLTEIAAAEGDDKVRLQTQYNDLLADEQQAAYDAAARLERDAVDKALKSKQDALQREREELKASLDEELAMISEKMLAGKLTADQAMAAITATVKAYGLPMAEAGTLLGNAFAQGLEEAMGAVQSAVTRLGKYVEALVYALAGNVKKAKQLLAELADPAGGTTAADDVLGRDQAGRAPGDPFYGEPDTRGGSRFWSGLPMFAKGGTVPGLGRGDTVLARLTPGEEVIDRTTAARLRELLATGNLGGNTTVYATVLGGTERQVGAALEKLVTPAGARVVSYPAPR